MTAPPRPLALVTGGARRVGRAVCLDLAQSGCDLILTYRTSEAEAQQTAADCRALRVDARAVRLDLDDLDAVESFGRELAADRRRLDLLVHNASLYERTPWGAIGAKEAMEHWRINALAPLLLTQALAPALREAGGVVVAMCDAHTLGRARRRYAAYSMSKAALAEMVHTLARELAPQVRVCGIAPGVVAWPEQVDPAEIEAYESRIPLKRPGTPEDVARLVRFLWREGTYLTGEIIRLDGGRTLT